MSLSAPGVRILAKLAEGGSSVIYKAIDFKTNEPRAVKFLNARAKADGKMVKAFRAEAALLSGLNHEGLIKVYSSGESGDDYYMVMELFPGKNLKRMLQEKNPDLPRNAVDIFKNTSEAICYLHLNGIIHKDIKPENILIKDGSETKLIDLSIAERPSLLSSISLFKRAIQGTPSYMSPEQIQGKTLDFRTDIYSLGAAMYEMFAGIPPFVGRKQDEIFEKHLRERPRALRDVNKEVPEEVHKLIMQMLEKDPAKRVPDMNMLISRLSRVKPAFKGATKVTAATDGRSTRVMVKDARITFVRIKEAQMTGKREGYDGFLTNLSRAGIGFQTAIPPAADEDLDMVMVVPPLKGALRMTGRVMWINKMPNSNVCAVGVQISKPPPDYLEKFESLRQALRNLH